MREYRPEPAGSPRHRRPAWWLRLGLLQRVAIASLLPTAGPVADANEAKGRLSREYDLKAAFLFNFAHFVEWPPDAFPADDTPFIIGVLGEDPFGKSLDDMVIDERVRNRRLAVRRFRDVKEISWCHILFVSDAHSRDLENLRRRPGGASILTVGETDDFDSHAGIVRFLTAGNKVGLRINLKAAKE